MALGKCRECGFEIEVYGHRNDCSALLKKEKAVDVKRMTVENKLRADVDAVLRTEAGRGVFTFLFNLCGWAQADIPQDGLHRPSEGHLLYNATRRAVYGKLRSKASRALLAPMEDAAENLSVVEEAKPGEKN